MNNSLATRPATLASPKYTGAIGQASLPIILNPAYFISVLNFLVTFLIFSLKSGLSFISSNTFKAPPTIGGAIELENKYGLDFYLNYYMISFLPLVYPPLAPPNAFPRVPLIISISLVTPNISGVPYPVGPINPVAWHSSMKITALYFLASSTIFPNGAISPSIENTPSVTIQRILYFYAAFNYFSKSFISRWSYLYLLALHNLIPSIIEAWFKASEMTASCSPNVASNIPPFASKQLEYNIVSSVP